MTPGSPEAVQDMSARLDRIRERAGTCNAACLIDELVRLSADYADTEKALSDKVLTSVESLTF